MLDAVGEVMTAIDGISGLSVESGMPESFVDEDGTSVFSTYDAVGWVDLADNSAKIRASIHGVYRERVSKVAVVIQFYTLSSETAFDFTELVDEELAPLMWLRNSCDTRKEEISGAQTAFRTIMRYSRQAYLTVPAEV